MTRALIVGCSGQDGAYLARLLLARGTTVAGTTRTPAASATARLAIVAAADAVVLHAFDAATATPDALAALLDTVEPDQIYHLAGTAPHAASPGTAAGVEPWLAAIRQHAPATRLFAAVSVAAFGDTHGVAVDETTPFAPFDAYGRSQAATAATVARYRDEHGLFAVSGLLGAHDSRLAPASSLLQRIVHAARAQAAGEGAKPTLSGLDTLCDIGWAPEYVDAMTKMLTATQPRDCIIATGHAIPLRDFVGQAFGYFGLNWQAHVDAVGAALAAGTAPGSPALAHTHLGWRADTWGKDLVNTLCEAAAASPVSA